MAPRKRKSTKKSTVSCATPGKRKIYTGARGGQYYMCKGRKVYLKAGQSPPCAAVSTVTKSVRVPKGRRTMADVEQQNALFDQERAVQQTIFEQQVADANRSGARVVAPRSASRPRALAPLLGTPAPVSRVRRQDYMGYDIDDDDDAGESYADADSGEDIPDWNGY